VNGKCLSRATSKNSVTPTQHGPRMAVATEPARNSYRLTVACSCGVMFVPWVTTKDAELDLLRAARLN
jgi:hypothetical protein